MNSMVFDWQSSQLPNLQVKLVDDRQVDGKRLGLSPMLIPSTPPIIESGNSHAGLFPRLPVQCT